MRERKKREWVGRKIILVRPRVHRGGIKAIIKEVKTK